MGADEQAQTVGQERSKFGAGVVVCLAKFSEHMWCPAAKRVRDLLPDSRPTDHTKRAVEFEEEFVAKYPQYKDETTAAQRALSREIEMWMNGASDHFYDLDRERAPQALCDLADFTLDIGHGFKNTQWTKADWYRVHELWREACIAVDRQLGTEPDWGEY